MYAEKHVMMCSVVNCSAEKHVMRSCYDVMCSAEKRVSTKPDF